MSPSNPRTVATLLVIAALITGIVLGVAGDHVYMLRHRRPPMNRIVEHLDHELHFTPQQKTAVSQIIERHRARIDALSSSVRPQIRQEIEATDAEIQKVLTPEQLAKYQQFRSKMQQRHRERMRGPR